MGDIDLGDVLDILQTLDRSGMSVERFLKASQESQTFIGQLDNDQQLLLYGLFKQAKSGPCNIPIPDDKNSPDYYKWMTWKGMEPLSKEDAMMLYIYFVDQFKGLSVLGKKDSDGGITGVGSYVSTLIKEYKDEQAWKTEEAIHSAVSEGNLEKLQEYLEGGGDPNLKDDQGRTFLHYAADLGFANICKELLARGASINAQDAENQTPLMLAVICERKEVIKFLLENNASVDVVNDQGESVFDFLRDCDDDVAELFTTK